MAMTMRISLPGNNALTDGTIDDYSLYVDSDNLLIKELTRGTTSASNNGSVVITHSLGYVPFSLTYCQVSSGRYRIANAFDPVGSGWKVFGGTSALTIQNSYGTAGTLVQYYIFYDNVGG